VFRYLCRFTLAFILFTAGSGPLHAQEIVTPKYPIPKDSVVTDSTGQTDVSDVYNFVFHKNKKKIPRSKKSGSLTLLPSVGYTPSTGFAFGADVSGTRYLGDPETTTLSVFDAFAEISTNELALIQLTHNIYTAGNQWNIQGSYNLGKTVVLDHGLGTGREMPEVFPIRFSFIKLSENVYRNLFPNFYAGAGLAFNYYTKIDEELNGAESIKTHNYAYSIKNGYPINNYFASGLLINLQYNTRDQPYRPYKGIYIDVILRSNQKWLGSEKSALQLKTELRKYWSLSATNPEEVLAYWLWGSYLLNGSVPYLELPGTGSDINQRIGRGYTIGRFKGPSFFYNEMEYRFPISRNKLLSGVAFFNMESASNQKNIKVFNYWEPGAGAGLRILFDKHTRSNLCIDYGVGNYGANGVFVGLNEVF
jgi:outer membrane protein assembly factor BamA